MWGEGKLLILDLGRNPVSKKETRRLAEISPIDRGLGAEKGRRGKGGEQRSNDVQVAKRDEGGRAKRGKRNGMGIN